MWGGRFAAGPSAVMEAINASIDFDKRMAAEDIAGSRAHAAMLARQGIINQEDQVAIDAGLDQIWVPEAYSFDAPSAMGYLAANTERVTIASGILPIYSRTPTLLATTAAGIDYLSDGRCMLGLGASGPQQPDLRGAGRDAQDQRLAWRRGAKPCRCGSSASTESACSTARGA